MDRTSRIPNGARQPVAVAPHFARFIYLVDPNAVSNLIGYTPQPTPSSFVAQIKQIIGEYALLVPAMQNGDISDFFQAPLNIILLYATAELEIFNFVLSASDSSAAV